MDGSALHHIGCVVDSIERHAESYSKQLAAPWVSEIFLDPIQRSRVTFLQLSAPGNVLLELVEPADSTSPVMRFLEKGGGLHHLCYEVGDLDEKIKSMKAGSAILIRSPKPAVAFNGRRIAWMRTPDGLLVEYLERTAAQPVPA